AEKNLMYALGYAPDGGIYSEIYFKWSESIRKLGDVHKSDSLNSLGLYFARTRVAGSPSVLIYWLLLGEAYIYSDIADSALTHLQIVEKNENRKYYIGRNFLAMGKAYDLMGKRDEAKKYYKNVLDNRSAVYHKREAEKLLKTQYKLYDY
ncbi:MAG: hypothetical protein GY855_07340, partial [candidate division Zixibacteria bacterium]|nr:hypothetical protein [candidate division Zixibacteria bacterium]